MTRLTGTPNPLHYLRCVFAVVFSTLLISACTQNEPEATANASLYFSVKPMGPSVNIRRLSPDGEIVAVTDDPAWRDLEPDISATGETVFISNRKQNHKINLKKHAETYDLFILTPGETIPRQITQQEGTELNPRFSLDGKKISYILKTKTENTLALMSRQDNSIQTLLIDKQISHYDWAPDGVHIYAAHYSDEKAFVSKISVATGKVAPIIEFDRKAPSPDYQPNDDDPLLKRADHLKVSPDGKKLAYIRNPFHTGARQLRVLDMVKGSDTLLSSADTHAQDGISWSSDSSQLLFSALVGYRFYFDETSQRKVYEGGMHIFKATLDGKLQQLTQGDHLFRKPTYSPNENQIVFLYADILPARENELKAMDLDGANIKTLAEKVAPASNLTWK